MSEYRMVSLSEEIADEVRWARRSPQYGHPVYIETASGFGPCRLCLETFREGREERVLFTYNSFTGRGVTPQPGPVFIHLERCERYEGAGVPSSFDRLRLQMDGYDESGRLLGSMVAEAGSAAETIEKVLAESAVSFINIRNAEAGCFVARVEREQVSPERPEHRF